MTRPTNLHLRLCLQLLQVGNHQFLEDVGLPRGLAIEALLGLVLVAPSPGLLVAPAPSLIVLLLVAAPVPGLTGHVPGCLRLDSSLLPSHLWLLLHRPGPLPRLRPGLRPGGLFRRRNLLYLMPLRRVVVLKMS